MEDRLEIIVTEDDAEPRRVRFEDLFAIRESLTSIMLLWNTNSYYVDRLSNTFIVNGGRRIRIETLGEGSIVYRRRNSLITSLSGQPEKRSVSWVIGLQGKENPEQMAILQITEDGSGWELRNKL